MKRRCYYFKGNQHLCQYKYEDEKNAEHNGELQSLKLVKHQWGTCKILTKTHKYGKKK